MEQHGAVWVLVLALSALLHFDIVFAVGADGAKPGVCPRNNGPGLCVEFCSNDGDCPNREKCCHNGCGHQCTALFTAKPGVCPRNNGPGLCVEFCSNDGDCPNREKCCHNGCGHQCTALYTADVIMCPYSPGLCRQY
ncbi:WAP four-disulfide core domain protein 2-like [Pseudochaenichthys georgianus]|uniref:WAP four-disulfide core domain protein 2-like n=1 Tax=Pseudochaenichthys georgianus TaxID=52239 RepID=UPI00146DB513|nr:waprin-Phi1-like [Pseudochaenichthys georgianus]